MGVAAPAMAPSRGSNDGLFDHRGLSRAAAAPRADDMPATHELDVLQTISIALGAFGIISTLFAIYWFVRMRRNFRQE